MTTPETDHTEGFPPRWSSAHHPGGAHRRPRAEGGRAVSSAVFIAACTVFGLAVATGAALAVPRPGRTAVFLAVQAAATFLAVVLGLLRRTRRASDTLPGAAWPAPGEFPRTTVNGGGAIPDAG
ncbi:hypothetical protein ACFV2H_02575 [Streptomyces sp. NPDC059629]|uniref:hypothetical protein n=1 Tax=Streptomyces sp. NPDC059629 TaxID=3346889 RepID=UPI00368699E1